MSLSLFMNLKCENFLTKMKFKRKFQSSPEVMQLDNIFKLLSSAMKYFQVRRLLLYQIFLMQLSRDFLDGSRRWRNISMPVEVSEMISQIFNCFRKFAIHARERRRANEK